MLVPVTPDHLPILPLDTRVHNGVYLSAPLPAAAGMPYIRLREQEGRILRDEDLLRLVQGRYVPEPVREWRVRLHTAARMQEEMRALGAPLRVLEIGCGNGWLSAMLASVPAAVVTGLDIFPEELEQAARVLGAPRLAFTCADLFTAPFPPQRFDLIILAAAVQYFPDLDALFRRLRELLQPQGRIWVADSPFYRDTAAAHAARARSLAYYRSRGFPEMAQQYHAHLYASAENLGGLLRWEPDRLLNRLRRKIQPNLSPFPCWEFRA